MPERRACCAELDENSPSAQGTSTSAASNGVPAQFQARKLVAISARPTLTQRAAPTRSIQRASTRLPNSPKTPNHRNIITISVAAPSRATGAVDPPFSRIETPINPMNKPTEPMIGQCVPWGT